MKATRIWFLAPILGLSSLAPAAIVANLSGATAGANAFDGQISAADLVNAGQASLGSVAAPAMSYTLGGFSVAGLNDGSASANGNITYYQSADSPETITFNFNTSAGTGGSASGYNITSVKSFAGWANGNIGAQSFQLLVSTISQPSFTSLGTFTNTSGFTSGTTASALSSLTTLTDNTGTIASGVTGLRFIYTSPTSLGVSQGGNGGTVIREIDVAGTPAPEPGSLGLVLVGGIGLLARRRRTV